MQLMELDVPMVLALNMMDEVRGNGGYVHLNKMEKNYWVSQLFLFLLLRMKVLMN